MRLLGVVLASREPRPTPPLTPNVPSPQGNRILIFDRLILGRILQM